MGSHLWVRGFAHGSAALSVVCLTVCLAGVFEPRPFSCASGPAVEEEKMWGVAFSLNPKDWRLGWVDAKDIDPNSGRAIVVGRWFFLGPIAVTHDYE